MIQLKIEVSFSYFFNVPTETILNRYFLILTLYFLPYYVMIFMGED